MNITKHKIKTHTSSEFFGLWEALVKRLDQAGEEIVRTKFSFNDMNPFGGFRATVWTKNQPSAEELAEKLAETIPTGSTKREEPEA